MSPIAPEALKSHLRWTQKPARLMSAREFDRKHRIRKRRPVHIYRCANCGKDSAAPDRCPKCGSGLIAGEVDPNTRQLKQTV